MYVVMFGCVYMDVYVRGQYDLVKAIFEQKSVRVCVLKHKRLGSIIKSDGEAIFLSRFEPICIHVLDVCIYVLIKARI